MLFARWTPGMAGRYRGHGINAGGSETLPLDTVHQSTTTGSTVTSKNW